MTAVELLAPHEAVPTNDRWLELRRDGISASEIAAVLGISPWDSPFSLYWKKVNGWQLDDDEILLAGRYCEPAIADWWAAECDPLENLFVTRAGLYAHADRPWQLATPDRMLRLSECVCAAEGDVLCSCLPQDGKLLALLECKWVAYSWDGWGEPGTDDIPVYYRAQALWQLDTLDVDEVHLAVLGPGGFRAYGPIRRDEKDLRVMRTAGAEFAERLVLGDVPDLDGHTATVAALKRIHPDVGDGPVEVDLQLAEGYRRARALKARAQDLITRYEARLRDALGDDHNRAMRGGRLVASRSVYERKPYEVGPTTIDKLNPGKKLEIPYA